MFVAGRRSLLWLLGTWLGIWIGATRVACAATTDLGGEWRYLPFEGPQDLSDPRLADGEWPVMRLPSNWFLRGRKTYPVASDLEPPVRGGEPGQIGIPQTDRGLDYEGHVWFRRHFTHSGVRAGRYLLRFEAVDYFAEAYLNGHFLGRHEGSFQPFEFDATPYLAAGDNVLAVRVGAPALVFDWSEDYPVSWPKHQAFIKGVLGYHDTRPGGTSIRGQERGTGGITGPVTLRVSNGIEWDGVRVEPQEVRSDRARLRITIAVRNWTRSTQRVRLHGRLEPDNFPGPGAGDFDRDLLVQPGKNEMSLEQDVDHPHLWWSWDYGDPNLYRLVVTMTGGTRPTAATFGIRSIRHDDAWVWYLNGTRVYPRGTNYISTQWLSQADRAWYERDLKLMREANLNSVRVHAHLEGDEFYQLADAMGLMVWQDFPLQWGYSDAPEFQREARRQLEDMVRLYFNHPSIIVWCMHNESPHAMAWMQRKAPQQNLALDEALLETASRLDPSRVRHRDSGTGDGHPYPGWYEPRAAGFLTLPGAPFITEYGAQALPDEATLRTMFPPPQLFPRDDAAWQAWAFHDFQYHQTFHIAGVPQGDTIQAFIANSQHYQGALLHFATELYRRAKWTRTTGLYQFMFVDDWPSITWSVVDYYRRPKFGYQRLKLAMQPVLPSIEYRLDDPQHPLTLWVVNDRRQAFPGARLRWRLAGIEKTAAVDVPADGVIFGASVGSAAAIASGKDRLEVWLEARDGTRLGQNLLEAADFISWKQ